MIRRTSDPIDRSVWHKSPQSRALGARSIPSREQLPDVARRRIRNGLLLLLLAPTLTWSQTAPIVADARPAGPAEKSQGDLWTRTELFFGSAQPGGSVVSEQEFRQFLDQEVTPRFPDGLTVFVGLGQFRHASGIVVQERSMLLVLLYPADQPGTASRIEAIRDAYKRRFRQESVLRLDTSARVSF